MNYTGKRNGSIHPWLWAVIGAGTFLAVMILGLVMGAFMIHREILDSAGMPVLSVVILCLSVIAGNLVCVIGSGRNMIPYLIYLPAVLLVLTALNLVIFGGSFTGVGKGIVCLLAGCAPGLCLIGKKVTPKKKYRKYKFR